MSKSGGYDPNKKQPEEPQDPRLVRISQQGIPTLELDQASSLQDETSTDDGDTSCPRPGTPGNRSPRRPLFIRKSRSMPSSCERPTIRHERSRSESQQNPHVTKDAYIIHSQSDGNTAHSIIDQLENQGLSCSVFDRDCLPNETIYTQLAAFLFESRHIVFFISPNFFDSRDNFLMHQWQMAIAYCADHEICSIVSLLIEDCEVHPALRSFPIIDGSNPNWILKLVDELRRPPPQWKAPCCRETHISLRSLCGSLRSVVSEPGTLSMKKIPDEIKTRIKIWHRSRSTVGMVGMVEASGPRSAASCNHASDQTPRQTVETPPSSAEAGEGNALPPASSPPVQPSTSPRAPSGSTGPETRISANISYLLHLRQRGVRRVEANTDHIPKKDDELRVVAGDVLELLEDCEATPADLDTDAGTPEDSQPGPGEAAATAVAADPRHRGTAGGGDNRSYVKNYLDEMGYVPTNILGPCTSMIPSQALKMLKTPPSKDDHERFIKEVLALGGTLGLVKEDSHSMDGMHVSVKRDEYVQVVTRLGRVTQVRTVGNELGYVHTCAVEILEAPTAN